MKGIVGNSRDAAFLERLGYDLRRDDREGFKVFEKQHKAGITRIVMNYPKRVFCIGHYDLELRLLGGIPKEHAIANLRDIVFD